MSSIKNIKSIEELTKVTIINYCAQNNIGIG